MDQEPNHAPTVVLAHLSDLHLTTSPLGWTAADWLSKRVTGWVNARMLARLWRFRDADDITQAMIRDLGNHRIDRIVFCGDASTLGFESELRHAARLLRVSEFPGLAVPGNHDYFTPAAARSGAFERCFAPWQQGERIGSEVYPFAQRVGRLWLVAVNSCRGNRLTWDASGLVDPPQLDRLARLLDRLSEEPRILVTHYPVALAEGQRERHFHGLSNLDDVLRLAETGRIALWLHGHRHTPYRLLDRAAFPVICAGSATEAERWSYGLYKISGLELTGERRVYDRSKQHFTGGETFRISLTTR